MSGKAGVVIAGAGQAGFQVAAALRDMKYAERIVIVGEEAHRPYQRPPLSKAYLLGTTDEVGISLRPEGFYTERNIEVRTGRRVVAVDRGHHHVGLDDDTVLEYDKLVFAVGARNRSLPVHGADLPGVHYLRTLDDARALKRALTVKNVVVVGAGFIGLEFASSAAKLGVNVTVIEVADRPMARALSPPTAAIFTREHAKHGVRFMFKSQLLHVLGDARGVVAVETVEHERVPADLVLIGIGVEPNVEVAAAAGLEIGNGIVVDDLLRTSDPDISAVGDCAAHPNAFSSVGSLVRLESVQNATDQARCVAASLAGNETRYASLPWFWSDQGNLKLQIAGLTNGCDHVVVRGDASTTACSTFCFREGRLIGVETVNRPGEHMLARRLIQQRIRPTPDQVADETFDLKSLLSPLR